MYGLCRRRPSLILRTMEGNPGGAARAERPGPPRNGWRADRVRASDADRDDVISQLRERYAEGRLTHDTLDHRLESALQARYRDDLAQVLADLPTRRTLSSTLQACWQRGWATVAGLMSSAQRPAPARVLLFPSGDQSRFTIGIQAASMRPRAKAPAEQPSRILMRSRCERLDIMRRPVQQPNNTVMALPKQLMVV